MGLTLKPSDTPLIIPTRDLDRQAMDAMLGSGRFHRVRRGALTPAPTGLTAWQLKEHVALAHAVAVGRKLTNGAVISHSSAALVHGLWLYRIPEVTHITQPAKPNGRGARDIARHCGAFDDDAVTTVDGLRVTTIGRTIVDCARTMHPRDALVVADAGMRALIKPNRFRREVDEKRIVALRERLLEMVGRGAGHGRRRARAVIRFADPYAESPMESVLRWIAVSHGLPAPTTQLQMTTRGGTFFADFGWWGHRQRPDGSRERWAVLAEYDGELKYVLDGGVVATVEESSAAVVSEKRREDLLREEPTTRVLRFVRLDLNDPEVVFRRLFLALPEDVRAAVSPVPELLTSPRHPLR